MGLDSDDIKQLIAILQKGLVEEAESSTPTVPKKKKSSKKTIKDKEHDNLFEKMPEFKMHKKDVEIDRKLRQAPPTERSRNYTPIKLYCRVCHKEELVNPALVESADRYKCNKCSTSAG